jgi:hypothetical protein
MFDHINFNGRYTITRPELGGGLRPLRDLHDHLVSLGGVGDSQAEYGEFTTLCMVWRYGLYWVRSRRIWLAWCAPTPRRGVWLNEGRRTLVSHGPLGPEPEPTQKIVDLSGETTEGGSDLQGIAAVPDEAVPQSTPAEIDLAKEPKGTDPTISLEQIRGKLELFKIFRIDFLMGVKKFGPAVTAALALLILTVAAVLLIYFAPAYTAAILVGYSVFAALLILLVWLSGRGGHDN